MTGIERYERDLDRRMAILELKIEKYLRGDSDELSDPPKKGLRQRRGGHAELFERLTQNV